MSGTRNRTEVASVRLNEDELRIVQGLAADRDQTISTCLREVALLHELRSRPGARTFITPSGSELTVWMNAVGSVSCSGANALTVTTVDSTGTRGETP